SDLLAGRRSESSKAPTAMLPKMEAAPPHNVDGRLPYELPWDLLTLLASASESELPLTLQDSQLAKRVAKRINDSFLHPVDIKNGTAYIEMVMHLARTLGLLTERQGDQPALAITPRADEWAKLSFAAQR